MVKIGKRTTVSKMQNREAETEKLFCDNFSELKYLRGTRRKIRKQIKLYFQSTLSFKCYKLNWELVNIFHK